MTVGDELLGDLLLTLNFFESWVERGFLKVKEYYLNVVGILERTPKETKGIEKKRNSGAIITIWLTP